MASSKAPEVRYTGTSRKTWPGKKHPYIAFLDEVREKLVELGFKEMTGTAVETTSSILMHCILRKIILHASFRSLFCQAARICDTSKYSSILENVKKTHETGGQQQHWLEIPISQKEAERLILRAHGTCLSARTLIGKDLQIQQILLIARFTDQKSPTDASD